jgi:large subunit ribosomal protein L1
MAKHSKRFNAAFSQVDRMNYYAPEEAVSLVEVHLRMGVDPKYSDQQVRGVVTLPNGIGRTVRILVFANPEGQTLAREAGADYVGADDLAEQIVKGWTEFDVVLATPDMMRVVGKLGKVLGPRGLMPSPKTGTIVPADDLPRVIGEARLGRVEFRVDKGSNIHVPIGKVSFPPEKLLQNFAALMEAVVAAKPAAVKGIYIHRVTLASSMGPGVKTDVAASTSLKADAIA